MNFLLFYHLIVQTVQDSCRLSRIQFISVDATTLNSFVAATDVNETAGCSARFLGPFVFVRLLAK